MHSSLFHLILLDVNILICNFHIKQNGQAKLESKLVDEEDVSEALTRLSSLATTVSMAEFQDLVEDLMSQPYYSSIKSYVSYWLRKQGLSAV